MWSIESDACAMIGCGHVVGNVLEVTSLVDVVGDGMGWDQVKSITFGSRGGDFGGRAGGRHVGRVGVG